MREGLNVIVRYDEAFNGVNVWIIKQMQDGSQVIVLPIQLTAVRNLVPEEATPEPTLRFHGNEARQFLQDLADGLVQAGFRPDELKSQDQVLEATKYHLEDMRKLVLEALAPSEPMPQMPRR